MGGCGIAAEATHFALGLSMLIQLRRIRLSWVCFQGVGFGVEQAIAYPRISGFEVRGKPSNNVPQDERNPLPHYLSSNFLQFWESCLVFRFQHADPFSRGLQRPTRGCFG